jgi:indolepyruvate decarboxylase
VVVLSGGPGVSDTETGFLIHHQAKRVSSQITMFKEITCDQVILDDPPRAPEALARVLQSCLRESRPVYIEVPRDRVFAPCDPVKQLSARMPVDADALAACIAEILTHIAQASSPVLMVGIEIRRYGIETEVAELARKLGIPVVTTFMGRGLLTDAEELSGVLAGTYLGVAGDPAITALVEQSDCLILLGVILSDTNFGVSEKKIDLRKTILACDGQVSLGFHLYPQLPLFDLVTGLEAAAVDGGVTDLPTEAVFPRGLSIDDQPITPTDIATAVNDVFDATGAMPIAADMGDCLFTALDIDYTHLVAPGYYATMGYGVPAGLGVQAATGRRPLIVVGDGAFQMTGWELLNCGRYDWDPVVLVFNNRSWEMLRAFQPESKFNDLDELNYADIAKALGGVGVRVRTRAELGRELQRAVAERGKFQLIEIMLERGVLSQALARFVAAQKKLRGEG